MGGRGIRDTLEGRRVERNETLGWEGDGRRFWKMKG